MANPENVDPYSQEALNNPGSYYDDLRERCPVAHVENPDAEFYIISGYDRVREVMTNHDTWTKKDGSFLFKGDSNIALNQDPPQFNDFRKTYVSYMSQNGVKRWTEDIRTFANQILDDIIPLGEGDFHDLFAMPLPMRVMALIVGIPQENLEEYKLWSDTFMTKGFNKPKEVLATIEKLYAFFDIQFEKRRELLKKAGIDQPTSEHIGSILSDDIISILMTSRVNGRYLTDAELRRTTRGFFIGGNETTTSLILNILVRLHEKPERWERLKAEPELIPNVIEESLRCDPPTLGMFRGARCPVDMEGIHIDEDKRVMFSIPSANRDPKVFERPTEFHMDRPLAESRKHVTFSFGTHFCPGAWLSRMETRLALEVLVERMPDLRVTGSGERIEPFCFWGRSKLPVAWN